MHNMPFITFTNEDFKGVILKPIQDDFIVIGVEIAKFIVRKTLLDQGGSAYIIY